MNREWREGVILRLTLWLCGAQLVVVGIATPFVLYALDPVQLPHRLLLLAHVLAFAAAGTYLAHAGVREERARVLAALFLLLATTFSYGALQPRLIAPGLLGSVVTGALLLHLDALSAYFMWRFVTNFPRAPETARALRWLTRMQQATLVVGIAFLCISILAGAFGSRLGPLAILEPDRPPSLFFPIECILILAALAVLARRTHRAPPDERRRAAVLVWGIVIGIFPTLAWTILEVAYPSAASDANMRWARWLIYPALLSQAVTIPYAVVARQALDISVIVRRAVDYAFSRHLAEALLLLPAVLAIAALYRNRAQPVAVILSGTDGIVLIVLALLSLLAFRQRRRVLHAIDRAFFRERYDPGAVKQSLERALAESATAAQLARSVNEAVARSLHPTHASLLLLDDAGERLVDPLGAVPAVGIGSPLVTFVSRSAAGVGRLLLDRAAQHVGDDDRAWFADVDAHLVFPVLSPGAPTSGLLVLGEKQSGLEYTDNDRAFIRELLQLAALASAGNNLTPRHGREPAYEPAFECSQCGVVAASRSPACASCGGSVTQSLLPALVAGKFRVEARIGVGGMGVVYRAEDAFLERKVALKTLPYAKADESARLRREARAMAAVTHPHLASIYSLEMWGGRPILVCEFLANGTLAHRLAAGPLSEEAAITIGLAISGALARMHRSGVLHRDIKPSNIGFTETAEPKLLDFGLARILHADDSLSSSTGGAIAGTLLYASPDVLSGGPPTTDADVWGLSMSLYEAVAGTHPFGGRDIVGTITAVSQGMVPDIREFKPDVSPGLAELFRQALARDSRQRPATATAFMSLLSPLLPAERNAA